MKEIVHHQARPLPRLQGALPVASGLVWLALLAAVGNFDLFRWSIDSLPTILSVLLAAGALHLLPGLAILQLIGRDMALSGLEQLCFAWGIGIALPPLMLELAHMLGLPWTRWTTLGYLLSAGMLWLAPRRAALPALRTWRPRLASHTAGLLLLTAVALLVRLHLVRDLPVGMWGDSYQHTMMAQLLVDNHGLFTSWEPYAPLVTFTYHFGFHANAALFHWLSGFSVADSILYTGQVINAATLPIAYVFAARLSGSRMAGLWAAALTGFVNTQPIYYVNWGRYTQLTGQVILPIVLLCWIAAIDERRWRLSPLVLAGMMSACLVLTHYLVTVFTALFVCAYLTAVLVRDPRWETLRTLAARAGAIGALALLFAAPWLLNMLSSFLTRLAGLYFSPAVSGIVPTERTAVLEAIPPFYVKGPILALALLAVLVAVSRRNWKVLLIAAWSQLLLLVVVPNVFGLPGTGMINTFAAYIALYVTVVPLAAYALGAGFDRLDRLRPQLGHLLSVAGLIGATVWGVQQQQYVLNPTNQLFTPADEPAMEWIRANTPDDARFLVNMFPAYSDTLVAGSDAGWWIPLLTGRSTTLPPLTYGSERAATPDYAEHVNAFAATLREHPLPSEEGIRHIRAAGIEYVYCGAHIGQDDPIDVAALRGHPAFSVVYDKDDVVIFRVASAR